jgi:CRP/FNR family transcriptional regulator
MDSHSHDVFWEALDDMELLQINIDHIRTWVADNPKVQGRIMNYLGQRMRQLEGIATDISLNNTLVRLCHLLLKHVNDESHKLTLIDNLGNDELASLIGTTRAVVNRHIQELKHCGAITVGRKHIDIQNISRLLEIAEEKYFP